MYSNSYIINNDNILRHNIKQLSSGFNLNAFFYDAYYINEHLSFFIYNISDNTDYRLTIDADSGYIDDISICRSINKM